METNKVGIFVIAFITLLVGIVLLDTTADTVYLGTDAVYTATEEAITLSNTTAASLANNWVTGITTVLAEYGAVNATLTSDNYTVSGLNLDSVPTIILSDDQFDGNSSWITYTYQDDSYIRNSQSRVLIRLITLFFALAILATALWAMYKMGIMDLVKK